MSTTYTGSKTNAIIDNWDVRIRQRRTTKWFLIDLSKMLSKAMKEDKNLQNSVALQKIMSHILQELVDVL